MAPNLSWLHACKSAQLRAIATAIGINSSGTKAALTSQLLQHLPNGFFNCETTKPLPKGQYNIISIDMGIRNLAYCRLTVPQPPPLANPDLSSWNASPTISQWARIEISKTASKPKDHAEIKVKEAFDPATYSQHAYNLVTSLFSNTPTQPTHVLIERQRFRSMGGSAVQEWTLRVNMFEAMIYAVLKTLAEKGIWRGSVYPVAPARVSKFWLGDKEGADAVEGGGSKSTKTKTAKIDLVGRWLEDRLAGNGPFELEGKAKELGRGYLRKRKGSKTTGPKSADISSSSERVASTEIGKLDDLADCLLQGMAFIKWERNRRLITAKGLDALDEAN